MKMIKTMIISLFLLGGIVFLASCDTNTPPVGGGDPGDYTIEDAINYLTGIIPEYVSENMDLPTTIENTNAQITWSSNYEDIIGADGTVNRGTEFQTVRLSARVQLNGKVKTLRKDVKVIPFETPLPKNKKLVFGYFYAAGSGGFDQVPSHKLDVINYAFAYLSNGKIDFTKIQYADQILRLKERGVKVVISLGGGGSSGGFSVAVSTESNRKALIESIIEGVKKYHFSGVDVDWEYPGSGPDSRPTDKENFTIFLRELKEELHKYDPNLILTAALGIDPTIVNNLDVPGISEVLDYAHLMTYDFVTNGSTLKQHLTNLYSSSMQGNYSVQKSVMDYRRLGMPDNKIVIGAAFYGREATIYPDGSIKGYSSISYTEIKNNYLNRPDLITYYFDEAAKSPYLLSATKFVTFDDPTSVKLKCEFVKSEGLAGIMFWQYNQDATGELLDAIYRNIN